MPQIGPMFAESAKLSIGYGARLLKEVPADMFARFAKAGDTIVESNHPSFIYGHLSLYAHRVVTGCGCDASSVMPSEKFESVFSKDATCVDDAAGDVYPPMDEVTKFFFAGYEAAIEALENVDDEVLLQENTNEAMRKRFATQGAMFGFYMGGHIMMHMGQMSAWRRAAGLGAA